MMKKNNLLKSIASLPTLCLVFAIKLYQRLLSPDHSWLRTRYPYGYCRHYPSCSEYSKQAIESRGLFQGGWLAIKRIARCNPWTEPKVDLVPPPAKPAW